MNVTIRSLRPDDLPEAAALIDAAFHAAYVTLLSPRALAAMSPDYLLANWTTAEDSAFIGLLRDGLLAGVARVGPDPESRAIGHVFSLYVHPQQQGRGFGQLLLQAATEELQGAGYGEASLWVFEANVRANDLYRRAGWLPTGRARVEPEWEIPQIELHLTLGNA